MKAHVEIYIRLDFDGGKTLHDVLREFAGETKGWEFPLENSLDYQKDHGYPAGFVVFGRRERIGAGCGGNRQSRPKASQSLSGAKHCPKRFLAPDNGSIQRHRNFIRQEFSAVFTDEQIWWRGHGEQSGKEAFRTSSKGKNAGNFLRHGYIRQHQYLIQRTFKRFMSSSVRFSGMVRMHVPMRLKTF